MSHSSGQLSSLDLPKYIEHTCLSQETDEAGIRSLCAEAIEAGFHGVVVNPAWVKTAAAEVNGTSVVVVSVAGFPLGAQRTDVKIYEALKAFEDGATEVDIVANIGFIKSGRFAETATEILTLKTMMEEGQLLKVIIEANKLTAEEQKQTVKALIDGKADFVKTGTGFFGPTSVEQVAALVQAAEGRIRVKAAGGIRTVEDCLRLIEAGADRIGTSAGKAIFADWQARQG